ncbi:MAG: protein kinase [Gemmatimonadetes bacterium]|nr:protein kinase [Gemmatimonadota bacterium]
MSTPLRMHRWRSLGLPARVFLGGAALVLVLLGLVFVMLSRWAQRSGDAVVQRELEQSADLVAQFLSGRQRSLTGGARVFVQDPYFRSFVAEHRREDVLDQTLEAAEQLEASWVFVVDERGTLLAKSDELSASGVDLSGVPLVAGALQGRITSGFGVSRDSLLFQAVAVPIVVPGGAPIGALIATKIVDSLLAREVKEATSADIAFFVRAAGGPRIAASTLGGALKGPLAAEVTDQTRSRALIGGVRYSTQGSAVTTAGGDVIGGFVVMSARDAASAEIAEVRRALLLAGLVGLSLFALAAVGVARGVARPVRALISIVVRATDGEYRVERTPSGGTRERGGEIGALDDALHLLVAELRDRQALVSALNAALPAMARYSAPAAAVAATSLTLRRVQGGTSRAGVTALRAHGATHEERPDGELAVGDLVADRYRIDGVLGSGDMGVTYRARDRVAGEVVALKRLRALRLGQDAPRLVELLRAEIRSVRGVAHRNIVRMYDVGEDGGVPFVTMDHVDGISLAELLKANGPLDDDAVLSLAKQLCRALEAARAGGVVHGSLSPRQLLIGYDGVLKVGDFALAHLERRVRGQEHADKDAASGSAIPQLAGATVGTPEYMAPEQMLGEEPTARADIYAAGVVLYECVTGATPFRTDSPLAFLAQKLGNADALADANAARTRPARTALALVLSDVIGRMIMADAERRPSSAGALLELLEAAG